MAPLSLLQIHTHKGKQDGGQWGIFTNFDIFSTLFLYSIQGQTHVAQLEGNNLGQKISKLQKTFSNIFQNCKHFVQYKGIAQCFFSTKVRAKLLEKTTQNQGSIATRLLHSAHTNSSNKSIHNDCYSHFSSLIYGGSHEDEICNTYQESISR